MESGGHRWQRVPPTEKRGRVHTSTVTVAVMDEPSEQKLRINPCDLDWKTCRGSGPGGQHRNKTESAIQLTHTPSGLSVRIESERSQDRNRAIALSVLRARLQRGLDDEAEARRADDRKQKVGTGMRGDKVRTVRVQDGIVTDHRTGKKVPLRAFLRGDLAALS